MRLLTGLFALLMIAGIAYADGSKYVKDYYDSGYFTVQAYKDAQTKEVFKELHTTVEETPTEIIETVYLGYFEDGTMDTLKNNTETVIDYNETGQYE